MKALIFISIILSFAVHAAITPMIKFPESFNEKKYSPRTIREISFVHYIQESTACNNATFNDYYFPARKKYSWPSQGDEPETKPIKEWFCLYANGIREAGYDVSVKQKVVFSTKNNSWELRKSAYIHKDHKEKKYIPLKLYNIQSTHAKGFMVVDENITEDNKSQLGDKNLKKKIYFCMIQNSSGLCGFGNLMINTDGKEVDLTPYFLKSLESMELGVKE